MLVPAANGQAVKSIDEISNSKAYTIARNAASGQSGQIHHNSTQPAVRVGKTTGISGDDLLWAIHYSTTEKAYFLYNLGAGKFVSDVDRTATFTDAPTDVMPIFMDNLGLWVIDCGGSLLGLGSDKLEGKAIFTDDYTRTDARNLGMAYNITASTTRTITDEENAAIEARIASGRADVVAGYRTFIDEARSHAEADNLPNYAGAYDLSELEYALDHPDKYSIKELNQIYRRTLTSHMPQPGRYYVLRNKQRPSTNFKGNAMSVTNAGLIQSRTGFTRPQFQKSTTTFDEGLNLFTVEHNGADPYSIRLRSAATGTYITSNGNNNAAAWLTEQGTVFTIAPTAEYARTFTLQVPGTGSDTWLTVAGDPYKLVNYTIRETAMEFYLEEIKELTLALDQYGYVATMLPCPINEPQGAEILIPVEEADGVVYMETHHGILPANVPFILHRTTAAGRSLTVTVAETNPVFTNDNLLVGTNLRKSNPAPRHQLKTSADGYSFTYTTSTTALQPNTCYLLSESEGPLTISTEERPHVGITEITADSVDLEQKWYDLQGRRISAPTPGHLYINGTTRSLILVK